MPQVQHSTIDFQPSKFKLPLTEEAKKWSKLVKLNDL
jgi:hypothetical protein